MKKKTKELLERAHEDLKCAKLMKSANYRINASVMSQQCIEKCIKAIFRENLILPMPYEHDIDLILPRIVHFFPPSKPLPPNTQAHAKKLLKIYLSNKYSSCYITQSEITAYVATAEAVYNWATSFIK